MLWKTDQSNVKQLLKLFPEDNFHGNQKCTGINLTLFYEDYFLQHLKFMHMLGK